MAARRHHKRLRALVVRAPLAPLRTMVYQQWIIHSVAALIFVAILAANILIWPIPRLGFLHNLQTHQIMDVVPGSSADKAGLEVGDRIRTMYNRPYVTVLHSVSFVDWIASREQPIPMVVDRAGQTVTLAIPQDPPSLALQMSKLAEAILAIICWLTGYVLGVVRQHTMVESRRVAFFWLGMGGIIGSAVFAWYVAIPLLVLLVWLVVGIFIPFAVYMHFWFPPRPIAQNVYHRVTWVLCVVWLLINGSIVSAVVTTPMSLLDLREPLLTILPIELIVGLIGSSWVLQRDYQRTTIAHTRRQIRLISVACMSVACIWIMGRIVPMLTLGRSVAPSAIFHLVCGFVPLAYLAGTIPPTFLYRIDRHALRFLVHLGSITICGTLILLVITQFQLRGTAAVIALAGCTVFLYRPLHQTLQRFLPIDVVPEQEHRALDITIPRLAETLDTTQLASTVVEGVQRAFGQPALALFLNKPGSTSDLRLCRQERFDEFPPTLAAGLLTDVLRRLPAITDSRVLNQQLAMSMLTADEQCFVLHPSVALWCSIRHNDGRLMGLLIMGMRGDLDPYRYTDYAALHRLVSAAALAFAHSVEYAQRQEAEAIIRQLYRRLQTERDAMAQDLAQSIHDDILNGNLRLNIEALRNVAMINTNLMLEDNINLALETMEALGGDLRSICEDLHPTGLDDPLGLSAVVRIEVQKMQARWHGQCQFQEIGMPQPIAAAIQREVLRITKEALVNVEKHARAESVVVYLHYPSTYGEHIQLTIRDNGCTGQLIAPRFGHLGVRQMLENARTIGGLLEFGQQLGKGTTVKLLFPPSLRSMHNDDRASEDNPPTTFAV